MSLVGKIAVVTGATGALGRVVAKQLLRNGAQVVAVYRSEEKLKELTVYLDKMGQALTGMKADVTSETSVNELIQNVVSHFGRIDILMNVAGAYRGGSDISNTEESEWNFMMDLNLKSVFLCCRAAVASMTKQGYGKIINVSSRTAVEKRFRPRNSAYAVSKAGVIILTETLAEELKKYNINVNCILPSTIDTPQNRRNMPDADFSRWVDPEEIARVMLFLASDESKTISGASVPVYGKA